VVRAHLLAPGAFLLCALIWGSTWLAIKVGYGGIEALTGAALRFALAGLAMAPLMLLLRVPFPREAKVWRLVAAQAVLIFLLDYGLIYWGEQFITSGLTAVLFASMPLLTALAAHALLPQERFTAAKGAGIGLGILGLGVVFADSLVFDPASLLPMAAIVGSAGCAAVAGVLTKRDGKGLHPATYTAPAMALGGVLLGGAALALGEDLALPTTAAAWGSVAYLVVFGSIVAFLAYFWLLQRWDTTKTSMLTLLTPLVALALGAAFLGEALTLPALAGTALVLLGVLVTLRAPGGAEPATPADPDPRAGLTR
jgi:drug/metabolite transporter (DMT)-like permease